MRRVFFAAVFVLLIAAASGLSSLFVPRPVRSGQANPLPIADARDNVDPQRVAAAIYAFGTHTFGFPTISLQRGHF
jgi:hypothetical protein